MSDTDHLWSLRYVRRTGFIPNQWVASFYNGSEYGTYQNYEAVFLPADLSRQEATDRAWEELERSVDTGTDQEAGR